MLTAQEELVPLDFSTKFIKEQRVVRIREIVSVETYRARALAGIEKLMADLVTCGETATGAAFCILHDHFDWEHDVDLEICVPVRRWARLPAKVQSRRSPATTVLCVQLPPYTVDALTQVKVALFALETAVIENDWIFCGDVREVYPWGQTNGIKMHIPIVSSFNACA